MIAGAATKSLMGDAFAVIERAGEDAGGPRVLQAGFQEGLQALSQNP